MSHRRGNVKWGLSGLVGAAVAALALAACGSSSSNTNSASSASASATGSSTAAFTQAKSEVEKLKQRPTTIYQTEPIKGTIPKGKKLFWIHCAVPACTTEGPALEKAAAAVGWSVTGISAGGSPEAVKGAWEQLLRQNPEMIDDQAGFPPSIYKEQLTQAVQKKIPIVFYGQAELTPPTGVLGLVASGPHYGQLGGDQGKWVGVETNCKTNTLIVNVSAYEVLAVEQKHFEAELKHTCPGAKMTTYDAPLSAIGTTMGQDITQKLQANPEINSIMLAFSDLAIGLPQAFKAASIEPQKYKIVTQNQNDTIPAMLKEGSMTATAIHAANQSQWQVIDLFLRHLAGQPTTQDTSENAMPEWLATGVTEPPASEISSATGFEGIPNATFEAQYKRLWGVG
jgi:ABC-type sugar transport system substrate-binding protein